MAIIDKEGATSVLDGVVMVKALCLRNHIGFGCNELRQDKKKLLIEFYSHGKAYKRSQ